MLGFSLPKLLILIAVIAVVWYGFKAAGRINRNRQKESNTAARKETSEIVAKDMVQCPKCEAYCTSLDSHTCNA
ncbi:MAG: hypothetical protein CFH38_01427 [Alphaproteobacteria bacterium MarineAlpha10_Bin1]|jgi:hypothetical protein|nr:MAG: hypothetical protein CFH38_01427 [Alphaproteobacteria bacterium MarineAlpha10_Bin1]|tara:strand:- start:154 stop:375 length:222 start_codon:yes stop_codon:yes gene_type:complete